MQNQKKKDTEKKETQNTKKKRVTEKWRHTKIDQQTKKDTKKMETQKQKRHVKKCIFTFWPHFETTENSHLRRKFEITVKNTVLRSASL